MRGHIRKRGNRWAVVVDVGHDEEGRRRQKWHSGFTTRRDAQAALTAILGQVQQGGYVEPSKQTLAQHMREWLESIRPTVRLSTWAGYRLLTEKHIIPALGSVFLQRLTVAQLNGLYADLLAAGRRDGKGGLSPRSVHYVHATIRKALAEAVRWGRLARNVAEQASPPRQRTQRQLQTWSADELKRFLDFVQEDRLAAAYILAATTGLRRGELLGLRWSDVDLDTGRVSVSRTLITVDYEVAYSAPKTARGRRSIALDSTTVAALRNHRLCQLRERVTLGLGAPARDGLVFAAIDGSPLHPGQFSDRFDRLVKWAGVPRIRFHDLRHTHATLALQAGVHPKVVSERLGHSTVAITLDVYSHAIPALQEEAAAKVASLIFERGR